MYLVFSIRYRCLLVFRFYGSLCDFPVGVCLDTSKKEF